MVMPRYGLSVAAAMAQAGNVGTQRGPVRLWPLDAMLPLTRCALTLSYVLGPSSVWHLSLWRALTSCTSKALRTQTSRAKTSALVRDDLF